jgi:hypothetical protein
MGLCCCKHRANSSVTDTSHLLSKDDVKPRIIDRTMIRCFSDSELSFRDEEVIADDIEEMFLTCSLGVKSKDDLYVRYNDRNSQFSGYPKQ